jgi:glycosyltransferase involved in cell wall biosynthesis
MDAGAARPRFGLGDISVVVCAHRSRARIERTLPTWLSAGVGEVVIVDGESDDGTLEAIASIADGATVPVVVRSAPLRGLADARNVGTAASSRPIVLHAGPDNVVPPATLTAMLSRLDHDALVSCTTRLGEVSRYLDRAHDLSKRRLPVGPIATSVGTPYLARRELFERFPFDVAMRQADDTDLCERLRSAGLTIHRCPEACLEFGFTTWADVRERWTRWGAGDAQFYAKMRGSWTPRRRLRSRLRPFTAEVVEPARVLGPLRTAYALPFLVTVATLRWWGWQVEERRLRGRPYRRSAGSHR